MNVLFVCRGNAGRSQMAEAVFNHMISSPHSSSSVGTKVFNKDGSSADGTILGQLLATEKVVSSLAAIDIDASKAVRTQITEELVNSADLVVNMAEKGTEPEYLAKHPNVIRWEVVDPKEMSFVGTQTVLDHIVQLVEKLVDELSLETKE